MLALTHVLFIPSRLMPLSTFSRHCFAVVVVILSFIVDVIRSLVPEFNMMFGGKVKSLTESCVPLLSLCSDSGGDGVALVVILGGDRWLLL